MKQIIPFIKDINFNNSIYEITSIALEHNLMMENDDSVVGNFMISGKYKENDVNYIEKDFEYKLPFDITLDNKYNMKKVTIDIDNFYYEIVNDTILRVHIDVLVDNLVYLKEQEEIKNIEDDKRGDYVIIEKDEKEVEEKVEEEVKEDNNENIIENNITSNLLNQSEKYVTYKVHIVRDNETIDEIINKYNVDKEDIEKYNDINNIMIGSKIVIPANNE